MHVLAFFFRTLLFVSILVGAVLGVLYRQDVVREAANLSAKVMAKAHEAGLIRDSKPAPAKPAPVLARQDSPARVEPRPAPMAPPAPAPAPVAAAEAPARTAPALPSYPPEDYAPPTPVADVQMPAPSRGQDPAPQAMAEPQPFPPGGFYGQPPLPPPGYPAFPQMPAPAAAGETLQGQGGQGQGGQGQGGEQQAMAESAPPPFPPAYPAMPHRWEQQASAQQVGAQQAERSAPARRQVPTVAPATREAWAEARRLFWVQDLQGAEQAYQKLASENADEPDLPGELGNLYLVQGRIDEAIDQYYEAGVRALKGGNRGRAGSVVAVLSRMDEGKAEALRRQIVDSRRQPQRTY
ncbi:MAG: hypothetical protein H7840_04355 [Alphaproteobacteria bacterium]